jgi:hypothetical protein
MIMACNSEAPIDYDREPRYSGKATPPAGGGTVQKSRPTQLKRARERARQEKQQQKTARRLEAKSRKSSDTSTAPEGEDPDIAGIVPGPQPSPWGDDEEIT